MEKKYELTSAGIKKLKEELAELVDVKRTEVIERLKEARSFGDLSENSEYDSAKDEQALVEARIAEINHILENVKVIKLEGSKHEAKDRKVRLGRTVTIKDMETKKDTTLTIVGTLETNPLQNFISNESPLAVAIIGKKEGEEVVFEAPNKIRKVKIIKIHASGE